MSYDGSDVSNVSSENEQAKENYAGGIGEGLTSWTLAQTVKHIRRANLGRSKWWRMKGSEHPAMPFWAFTGL
jgi:hypothetical protein